MAKSLKRNLHEHTVKEYFSLTVRETNNYKSIISKHIRARKEKKRRQKEHGQQMKGRHFGNIYEVDSYDADGNRRIGYFKIDKSQIKLISTFIIKPESKLWIDRFEALNVTFISTNKQIETVVIERQNWNNPDSFMSVIPSTDMNWSGDGRKDVQEVRQGKDQKRE